MVNGLLEVVLVDAAGLKDTECFFGGIDPYVLIKYKDHERESSVARGEGSKPVWNEKFNFRVQYPDDSEGSDPYKLFFRVMDKDTFSADDLIGETVIYVEDLLALGVEKGRSEIHPRKYSVVSSNQSYNGGLRVGLIFTPNKVSEEETEEEFGGWKQTLHLHHRDDEEVQ